MRHVNLGGLQQASYICGERRIGYVSTPIFLPWRVAIREIKEKPQIWS